MEGINRVPLELVQIIHIFEGDTRELPLFMKNCQYILENFGGNGAQNQYIFRVITSRLAGEAAKLVRERDHISTWSELKSLLTEYFGDPRTEECLFKELKSIRIHRTEGYIAFCRRVQRLRSSLLSKLSETIKDSNELQVKECIYNKTSFNVFLYNLPAYFVRLVSLRNVNTLEDALKIVLEEQAFQTVYNENQSRTSNHYNKNQRTYPICNMNPNPPNNTQRQTPSSMPFRFTNTFPSVINNYSANVNFNNSFQMCNQASKPNGLHSQHAPGNASRLTSPVASGSKTDNTMRTYSKREESYLH